MCGGSGVFEVFSPACGAGKPEQSALIRAVRHDGDVQMPPAKRLPDGDIGVLVKWVKSGAKGRLAGGSSGFTSNDGGENRQAEAGVTLVGRQYVDVESAVPAGPRSKHQG